jgi:2-keto-4-pentenoate hydratase
MMRGMTVAPPDHEAIAAEALEAMDGARQIAPFSARYPGLTLEDAYRILARLCEVRTARGERVIGRKIGFTNRTIWAEYGVYAPMWGFVFDATVRDPTAAPGSTAPAYAGALRRAAHRARDRVPPCRRAFPRHG